MSADSRIAMDTAFLDDLPGGLGQESEAPDLRPRSRSARNLPPRSQSPVLGGPPQSHRRPAKRRPMARFANPEETPSFYLSLSDLMSLLLVFFVLIFSLTEPGKPVPESASTVRAEIPAAPVGPTMVDLGLPQPDPVPLEMRQAVLAVAGGGQGDPGLQRAALVDSGPMPMKDNDPAFDHALLALVGSSSPVPPDAVPGGEPTLATLLDQMKEAAPAGTQVETRRDKIIIRLPESITFALGSADIRPVMRRSLGKLAKALQARADCRIVVTGHTDDLPISTPQFASNWELSAARAAAVTRVLASHGLGESRITIRGLADQSPLTPNVSARARQINRRVEIELHPMDIS